MWWLSTTKMALVRKHTCQTYVNYRMNFWIVYLITDYSSSTYFLCKAFWGKASFWSKVVQPFCLFAFLFFPWSTQKRLSPFILKPEIEYHCWRAVSGPTSSASYLCTSYIEIKKKELIQQKWGWFTCYQKVW